MSKNPVIEFQQEVASNINKLGECQHLKQLANQFIVESAPYKYSYNFSWLGRPIIQVPQDMVALQELVWQVKPDLIIETGIAHGGSLILSASLLALLDYTEAVAAGQVLNPTDSKRKVIGIDIDIRAHNRQAIESHPMSHMIQMFQGSSIDETLIQQVKQAAAGYKRILVCLDSNHTHEHVLAELEAYSSLVTPGSYCIVYDTVVEDMPASLFPDRPWGPGNNPKTAVHHFIQQHQEFEIDRHIDAKLLISVAPDGFLRRL